MHDINIRPFSPPGTAPTWTRPRPFRITHVDLEISIDLAERVVAGEVTHQVEFMPHSGTLRVVELDQHELEINAVEISGMPVAFGRSPGRLVIEVPVDAGVSFPVRISFTARQPAKHPSLLVRRETWWDRVMETLRLRSGLPERR